MKITILCIAHSLGDERVVCRQAFSLAKRGHDVVVFGREDPGKNPPQHEKLNLQSISPMIRGASVKARCARIKALIRVYKRVQAERPDLIAAHEPDSAIVALLLRRKLKCPVHFDVHECFEEMVATRLPNCLSAMGRKITWKVLSMISMRADAVTVVSPVTERQHANMTKKRPVVLLHNSPPFELFPECNQNPENGLTLCHEGWLDNNRGMPQLFKAVKLASDKVKVTLLVIGKVGVSSESTCDRLFKELDLGGLVHITGWLPYDQVGKKDAEAQIGLVTLQPSGNNNGSLSNKLYSYMASGHAVIVPENSATSELTEKYQCGVAVDVTNPMEISNAIVELVGNPDRRKRMGENGRKAIREELAWNHMEEKLFTMYQNLIEAKG